MTVEALYDAILQRRPWREKSNHALCHCHHSISAGCQAHSTDTLLTPISHPLPRKEGLSYATCVRVEAEGGPDSLHDGHSTPALICTHPEAHGSVTQESSHLILTHLLYLPLRGPSFSSGTKSQRVSFSGLRQPIPPPTRVLEGTQARGLFYSEDAGAVVTKMMPVRVTQPHIAPASLGHIAY